MRAGCSAPLLHQPLAEHFSVTERIRDLRVRQAHEHGVIVGMPRAFAEEVAMTVDLLKDVHIWSDLTLGFGERLFKHGPRRWRIKLSDGWWMMFEWLTPWGPVELRLWHEEYG